jgi:GNAT superfamily N-acetyltransferase
VTTDEGYTEASRFEGLPAVTIRPARETDGPGLGDVWLAAWYATFDFPPSHPDDDVRVWLATVMMPTHEVWVATEPDGRVVAFLALSDDMIDQLYVTPDRIGTGIGSRLIATAKARRPDGLDLYCFQANVRARTFYEHHGFVATVFGDGSNNSEGQPDIRYAWRPDR